MYRQKQGKVDGGFFRALFKSSIRRRHLTKIIFLLCFRIGIFVLKNLTELAKKTCALVLLLIWQKKELR